MTPQKKLVRFSWFWLVLLIGFYLFPLIAEKVFPRLAEVSLASVRGRGYFGYVAKEIYEKKGDIDVLAVGPSTLWVGLNCLVVEDFFGKMGKVNPTVINISHQFDSEDLPFTLLARLLEHRRVKLLLLQPARVGTLVSEYHPLIFQWLLYKDATRLMPAHSLLDSLVLYHMTVMGMARHLLELSSMIPQEQLALADERHGTWNLPVGYLGGRFHPFSPIPPDVSPEAAFYKGEARNNYRFVQTPFPGSTERQFQLLLKLAKDSGIKVVVIHSPIAEEAFQSRMEERLDWPRRYPEVSGIVGIAGPTLFKGMEYTDVKKLFMDLHLNENGSIFFSKAISPTLWKLYNDGNKT